MKLQELVAKVREEWLSITKNHGLTRNHLDKWYLFNLEVRIRRYIHQNLNLKRIRHHKQVILLVEVYILTRKYLFLHLNRNHLYILLGLVEECSSKRKHYFQRHNPILLNKQPVMELESVVCKFVHNSNHRQIISNHRHKQLELVQECNFKRKHYYQHHIPNLPNKQQVLGLESE